MESYCLLCISLVSVLSLAAKDEVPELAVLMEKKVNVSESLGVTVAASSKVNAVALPDVCLQVLVNGEHIRPKPGLQSVYNIKNRVNILDEVPITFNSSEATLFDTPINVNISIFLRTPDGCETDQDQLLAKDTALLYDDRGIT